MSNRRMYLNTDDGIIEMTKEDQDSAAQYGPFIYLVKIVAIILIGLISLIFF